jgi:hypothetical protein
MNFTVFQTPIILGLAMAAASVAVPARAELVPIVWDASGGYTGQLPVPAGKFVELCEKLPAGTDVQWSFETAGPTNFNVHYHEGKEVRFPAKHDQVTRAEGVLKATVEQDYCWMWTNKGTADVSLKVQLQRR